jgi:hypothetical protein
MPGDCSQSSEGVKNLVESEEETDYDEEMED